VKPDNGAIISLVGGFDFEYSKFNNGVQARRQPGSNIKPFIYSAAFEKGYTAATVVNDAPFTKVDASSENIWRPKNSSGSYKGPTRLRNALKSSTNLVSIRLLNDISPKYAVDYLSNLGFDRQRMPAVNSLALGAADFTPLEVATGYAIFANGGYRVNSYFIHRIEDSNGNIIFEEQPLTVCVPCEKALANNITEAKLNQSESSNPLFARASVLNQTRKNAEAALFAEIDEEQSSNETEITLLDQQQSIFSFNNNSQSNEIQHKANPVDEIQSTPDQVSTSFVLGLEQPLSLLPELSIDKHLIAPRVIAEDNIFILNSMMKDVIHRGTASAPLRRTKSPLLKRRDLAGKTGTTNEAKDAWFSGYNGDYVATAWVGYSDYSRGLGIREFGGIAAMPIWQGFMEEALRGKPENTLKQPPGLITAKIDPATGLLAPAGMKGAIFEIFRQRFMPTKFATSELTDPFNAEKDENEEDIF